MTLLGVNPRAAQYPSPPVGRPGWTAGAHGRVSPAAGSLEPTGLDALAVKDHQPQI